MGKLTSTVTPQGIVGVSPFLDVGIDSLSVDGCIAILHEVRDPGNAGTVLRSADAAGADGVVFTASSVDPYNPKTVRSSAGSIFHLPIVRGEDTGSSVQASRDRGLQVLAMDGRGDQDLYTVDLSDPHRVRVRERGARPSRGDPGDGGRDGSEFHIEGRRSR